MARARSRYAGVRRGAAQSRHRAAGGGPDCSRRRDVPLDSGGAGEIHTRERCGSEAARGPRSGKVIRRFSLVLSLPSLDAARDDPERVEGSKDEPGRSWFDRLTTSGAVLFALLVAITAACTRGREQAQTARNLVLITIDTLRADHVGAYGYARAQTPALDGLARAGVRFDRAYAAAPITLPSHATLLTGRYPPGHGARDNGMAMSPVPTIATELKAKGFTTAAFV